MRCSVNSKIRLDQRNKEVNIMERERRINLSEDTVREIKKNLAKTLSRILSFDEKKKLVKALEILKTEYLVKYESIEGPKNTLKTIIRLRNIQEKLLDREEDVMINQMRSFFKATKERYNIVESRVGNIKQVVDKREEILSEEGTFESMIQSYLEKRAEWKWDINTASV